MMSDKHETKSSAKAGLSQWIRWIKRHVLRRRVVLKILLLVLRLLAGFDDD